MVEKPSREQELKKQISVILEELSQIRMQEIAEEEGEEVEPHGAVLHWMIIAEHQSMPDAEADFYNLLTFTREGQSRATDAGLIDLASKYI